MYHYAVNLSDVTRREIVESIPFARLLRPVLAGKDEHTAITINVDKARVDGIAIVLQCESERAEAIIHFLRMQFPRYVLRIYHSKTGKGSWQMVAA